ncbi:M48 family metallopeptidase [Amphritea sp. 2_MG-2023]|uniref:M48 family metallopeptidase n=1 Tax=Amphritea TaxID=515417 RepID=UPI001C072489|nr:MULTISPECIES: M48 family metallopeptidase [Amphritea]MBU2964724.1 M48 family metallopeptidase [Amphritea atlantica]MDO6417121.1 M48 family metallopeptidase [Amphritea sp. 2_MG-2023]
MKISRRFVPFLIISAAALLSGCTALQSIDKGLYNVAESITETDRVTGERTLSAADRSAQIQQGNAAVEQLLAAEKKAGRKVDSALDRQQYQRLVRIFDRVHQVSHLSQERWQPILIDRDSFNAFTTGGTYIVVHRGLMQQLNDDEVAAVMGHEIAHTVANHVGERQTTQQISLLASKTARQEGYQAAYTHELEREADRIGVLYSALAGYDPYAATHIWQRQYQQQGNARSLFAHDHPVNAERAAETKALADKVKQYYQAGRINPNAAALRDDNSLWQKRDNNDQATAGEGGGVSAILSTALGAYVDHQQAKQEAVRQAQYAQFVQAVERYMKLEQQRRVSNTSWTTHWYYSGSRSLKGVVMGFMAQDSEGKLYRYVAHQLGIVRPGQRFSLTFKTNDGVSLKQIEQMKARYYVDDALPY